ncbi:hypothetical protein GQ457_07G012880 [Hibiscus cannabinus]
MEEDVKVENKTLVIEKFLGNQSNREAKQRVEEEENRVGLLKKPELSNKEMGDQLTNRYESGNEVSLFTLAREFIPMIDEVFKTLVENTKDIKGAKVENYKFCASVHYRNVEENNWPTIAQCVHDIMKDYHRLRLTHGRKVLEIRPVIDWNKGKAVEFVLESLGLSKRDDVLPIYIGDDKTDEDAFKVLREGDRGCGILVSSVPKESNAIFSVRDTSEVQNPTP